MTRAHFVHLNQNLTLFHFLYLCPYSIDFWRDLEVFWHQLLKENIRLSLQDVLVGKSPQNSPSAKLLNLYNYDWEIVLVGL